VRPGDDISPVHAPGNVAAIRELQIAQPKPNARAELLQDAFTTFVAPLPYGELAHRNCPSGADTLSEVTDDGSSLLLADAALGNWCAVVPDTDGVARGSVEEPGRE
jgi:hypothetical protein